MLTCNRASIFGFCSVLCFALWSQSATAQENFSLPGFVPPTPHAAALARYGEYPVSHATGVPEILIPIYTIQVGDFSLPISLSYHASGNKVEDIATPVGLGWTLNAGGAIVRTIQGAPDLRYGASEDFYSYDRVDKSIKSGETYIEDWATDKLSSSADTERDRYTYNFAGHTGVFRYSQQDQEFVALNSDPIKVFCAILNDEYIPFYIVGSNGIEYQFEDMERTGVYIDGELPFVTSWYLSQINTPQGAIKFKYRDGTYFEHYVASHSYMAGEYVGHEQNEPDGYYDVFL